MGSEFKFSVSYKTSEGSDGFSRFKRYVLEIAILIIFLVSLGTFVWWKVKGETREVEKHALPVPAAVLTCCPAEKYRSGSVEIHNIW